METKISIQKLSGLSQLNWYYCNIIKNAWTNKLMEAWNSYQKRYEYAKGIKYNDVLIEVLKIVERLSKE